MLYLFNKIWQYRRDLRSIISSIYFNFHYLPLSQAIHLPILLYKPRLLALKGNVRFADGVTPYYGMVRWGFPTVSLYPNSGIVYENQGGSLLFCGKCHIGNNSAISIGENGFVKIGNDLRASTSLKLVNYYNIELGDKVQFGWECLVMDTDLHRLTKKNGGYTKGYGSISIGSNCWIANGCKVMKRTVLPNYCVVSAGTILSGKVEVSEYSVIGTSRKVEVLSTGIYRNIEEDEIDYSIE